MWLIMFTLKKKSLIINIVIKKIVLNFKCIYTYTCVTRYLKNNWPNFYIFIIKVFFFLQSLEKV